ncbi:hypothetical protein J5893_01385 [bacterium]|nr:hypothetical protein [bacterium]
MLTKGRLLTKWELFDLNFAGVKWDEAFEKLSSDVLQPCIVQLHATKKLEEETQKKVKECQTDATEIRKKLNELRENIIPIYQKVDKCENDPSKNDKEFLKELERIGRDKVQLRRKAKEIHDSKIKLLKKTKEFMETTGKLLPDEFKNTAVEVQKEIRKTTRTWPLLQL